MMFSVLVKNCPVYALEHKYIVATLFDGKLWFYGAFDYEDTAESVRREMGENTIVVTNE